MVTAYPDFRHYTTRDYGNRVGIFRLLKVLDEFNLKANFAINSEVASRYPALIEDILKMAMKSLLMVSIWTNFIMVVWTARMKHIW